MAFLPLANLILTTIRLIYIDIYRKTVGLEHTHFCRQSGHDNPRKRKPEGRGLFARSLSHLESSLNEPPQSRLAPAPHVALGIQSILVLHLPELKAF